MYTDVTSLCISHTALHLAPDSTDIFTLQKYFFPAAEQDHLKIIWFLLCPGRPDFQAHRKLLPLAFHLGKLQTELRVPALHVF